MTARPPSTAQPPSRAQRTNGNGAAHRDHHESETNVAAPRRLRAVPAIPDAAREAAEVVAATAAERRFDPRPKIALAARKARLVTDGDVVVLDYLAAHADLTTGVVVRRVSAIAAATDRSDRAVSRSIAAWEALGAVRRIAQRTDSGRSDQNAYVVVWGATLPADAEPRERQTRSDKGKPNPARGRKGRVTVESGYEGDSTVTPYRDSETRRPAAAGPVGGSVIETPRRARPSSSQAETETPARSSAGDASASPGIVAPVTAREPAWKDVRALAAELDACCEPADRAVTDSPERHRGQITAAARRLATAGVTAREVRQATAGWVNGRHGAPWEPYRWTPMLAAAALLDPNHWAAEGGLAGGFSWPDPDADDDDRNDDGYAWADVDGERWPVAVAWWKATRS